MSVLLLRVSLPRYTAPLKLWRCLLTVVVIMLASVGCERRVGPLPTLSNKGILPLSPTNAYVGANIFVANEAEKSSYLFQFLKGRGGPQAIELVSKDFAPIQMYLYYPAEREVYVAELQEGSEHSDEFRQWVVRGPYAIARLTYRDLSQLVTRSEEPLFVIQNREYRFRRPAAELPRAVELKLPPLPSPKPVAKTPKQPQKVATPVVAVSPDPISGKTVTGDLIAILMSEGYAERTSDGDLLHTAIGTQTIEQIARWYTGSPAAASEIRRASGLADGTEPSAGLKVRVPRALIKNFKAMPPG